MGTFSLSCRQLNNKISHPRIIINSTTLSLSLYSTMAPKSVFTTWSKAQPLRITPYSWWHPDMLQLFPPLSMSAGGIKVIHWFTVEAPNSCSMFSSLWNCVCTHDPQLYLSDDFLCQTWKAPCTYHFSTACHATCLNSLFTSYCL